VENAERLISCLLYFNKNSFQDFLKRFSLSGAWVCK
jgi:hypothetical protein